MINLDHIHQTINENRLQKLFDIRALQIFLVGVYFLLRVNNVKRVMAAETEIIPYTPCYARNRKQRRGAVRRSLTPVTSQAKTAKKNLTHLKAFMPDGISQTQFLERCARLSIMGRLRVYNFLYYRWAFWRIGAMRLRFRAPQGAGGPSSDSHSCGLSAAHLWPG